MDEALALLHKPSVKLFQRNLVVDILLGKIMAFFFGRQLHHRGLVFTEKEFPIQSPYQPVAILLSGVAEQDEHISHVAIIPYGMLTLLRLVRKLGKDRRDGIRLEVGRDVAKQNHAAAVAKRCHPYALIMEAVLLAEVLVNGVRHPCCLAPVYVYVLVRDILILKQPCALPLHALPYPRPQQKQYNRNTDCRNGNQPDEFFVGFIVHICLYFRVPMGADFLVLKYLNFFHLFVRNIMILF